ncbi:MAG: NHL repeat-containing protein [Candidatus Yanofskybacteria bacterium]|nr:NHL repeat-containing protein [Candidatus Yanofskybacteria bacterium]
MTLHHRAHNPLAVLGAGILLMVVFAAYTDPELSRFMVHIPNSAQAVGGYSAVDMLGQIEGTDTPYYTSANTNNTPNAQGFSIPRGSALDAVHHRLFIADTSSNRVLVFNLDASNVLLDHTADYVLGQPDFKTVTSATTQSGLNAPRGIEYDSVGDRLFVADENNIRVMIFDVASITNGENAVNVLGQTDFVSTAFGVAQNTFNGPSSVLFDSAGNRLFVTDRSNSRVLVFDIAAITDGENAVNVLGQPDFVTGTGATTQAKLYQPTGMAYDTAGSRLFVSDTTNNRVIVFDVAAITDGENAVNVLGQPDFTTLATAITQAKLYIPSGVAYDASGNRLFVADQGRNRVMVFDVAVITNGENAANVLGQTDFVTATTGTTQAKFNQPNGITYDAGGNKLYVPDYFNNRVVVFDVAAITDGEDATNLLGEIDGSDTPHYTSAGDYNAPNAWGLNTPSSAVIDSTNHRLFVSDEFNRRVLVFNLNASDQLLDHVADYVLGQTTFKTSAGGTTQSGLNRPVGLAYDTSGNRLFVADKSNNRVMVFDVAAITNGENAVNVLGQPDFVTGAAGTTQGVLDTPTGLALDSTGNRLFVADTTNNRVMVFDVAAITDGEDAVNVLGQLDFVTAAGGTTAGTLNTPNGLAYDSVNDRLFVGDSANNRAMLFDVAAITDGEDAADVYGQSDFTSAGSATSQSSLSNPYGLAFDATGSRLLVADQSNNRLMIFDSAVAPTPTPSPTAAGGGGSPPIGSGFYPERIVVNDDEGSTDASSVLVDIYARYHGTFSGTIDVLLSNVPDFATAIPFRYTVPDAEGGIWPKTVAWDLCFGIPAGQCDPGRRVVYARFYVNALSPEPALMPIRTPTEE